MSKSATWKNRIHLANGQTSYKQKIYKTDYGYTPTTRFLYYLYKMKINIAWHDRDVKTKEDFKHLWLCKLDEQKIIIREGMKRRYTNDTVVHELLHALFHSYYIRTKKEEEIVSRLWTAIAQVLEELYPWYDLLEIIQEKWSQ